MARRIYMDYASTTPVDKRVLKAMLPYMSEDFGNPSSIYKEGLTAKEAMKQSRDTIARLLNIRAEEIIFTASGTESDNLAVRGVFEGWKKEFKKENEHKVPHIITTTIEHPGILEICRYIEKQGGEVTYVDVDESGIVSPEKIKAALKPTTVLVTVMLANNEIGTIQPIRDISRILQDYKKEKIEQGEIGSFPYLHTDASQAANYLDLSFQKLGVDMMTLDASKIYGPKGVGLLASRRFVSLEPVIYGGGQERGIRSGTENVAGIVGIASALEIAQVMREEESERLRQLQEYFMTHVIKEIPSVFNNGDAEKRLPNNVNICIPGLDAEFAVIKLDHAGIACSTASSCINLSEEPYSYVLDALYSKNPDKKQCRSSSLRFTFGRATTKKDVDLTLKALASIMITQ